MPDEVRRAPDDRMGKEAAVRPAPPNRPFDPRFILMPQPISAFSKWSVAAILVGGATVCVHLLVWWRLNGTTQDEFMFSAVDVSILGTHFFGAAMGSTFAVAGLVSRIGNRWLFFAIAMAWTIMVFMAGIEFYAYGWVHIPDTRFFNIGM